MTRFQQLLNSIFKDIERFAAPEYCGEGPLAFYMRYSGEGVEVCIVCSKRKPSCIIMVEGVE